MFETNLNEAASMVCRNPEHIPQVIDILRDSIEGEEKFDLPVDSMVDHWWEKQLFLSINTAVA